MENQKYSERRFQEHCHIYGGSTIKKTMIALNRGLSMTGTGKLYPKELQISFKSFAIQGSESC